MCVFLFFFKERYRIQSDQLEDIWLIANELTLRLEEHFKKQNCKDFLCIFSGSIPLQEYFECIDHHFEVCLKIFYMLIEVSLVFVSKFCFMYGLLP